MLEKAVRQGILSRNVASLVDPPRKVHRELPMLTPDEVKAFIHEAKDHRLGSLFVLAITTGARQGELLGLVWNRVHLDTGEIEIRQSLQKVGGRFRLLEPKTARSLHTIGITDIAIDSLREHRGRQLLEAVDVGSAWTNDLNLVFTTTIGTPLDKTNETKRELRPLLKRAGLSTKLRFHDLRHSATSFALSQGVPIPDVSEMRGHADSATTLRVYAHAIPGTQRRVANAIQNLLS